MTTFATPTITDTPEELNASEKALWISEMGVSSQVDTTSAQASADAAQVSADAAQATADVNTSDITGIKTQAAWIDLTPLNAWVGTLKYRLDELGFVEVYASLNGVDSTSTTIATLPVGYRPEFVVSQIVQGAATNVEMTISTDGTIVCLNTGSLSGLINPYFRIPKA